MIDFIKLKFLEKKMGDQDARNYEYLLILELDETVNTLMSVTGEVVGDISECLMCLCLMAWGKVNSLIDLAFIVM